MLRLGGLAIAALLLPVGAATAHAASWKRIGPPGASIQAIAVSPSDPSTVLATTPGGVWRSRDAGHTWSRFGAGLPPFVVAGGFPAIAYDPQGSGRVFLGTGAVGIFRSMDGGATFAEANDGVPGRSVLGPLQTVSAFAFDPLVPDTVWAATTFGPLVSRDGGGSWVAVGMVGTGIPPDDTAYWTRVATDVVVLPRSPRVVLVAFEGPSSAGVYRLVDDGGLVWHPTSLAGIAVDRLVRDPSSADVVLATTEAGVQRSKDGGATWAPWSNGLLAPERITSLTFDPATPGRVWAGGPGNGVSRSSDGGALWTPGGTLSDDAVRVLALAPTSPATLLAGTADARFAGLFSSTDGGTSWSGAVGFTDRPVTTIAVASRALYVGGGAPRPTPTEYYHSREPQCTSCPSSATSALGIMRGGVDGSDWDSLDTGSTSPFVTTIVTDPNDSQTLYAGTWGAGVIRSVDGGMRWTPMNDGLGLLFISTLVAQATSPTSVFAGGSPYGYEQGGGVWTSTTAGGNWRATDFPGDRYVSALVADPSDARVVYAITTASGFPWGSLPAAGGVARSADAGASWTPSSLYGYPGALAVYPGDPATLWACQVSTLHRSDDGGLSWEFARNDLPGVQCRALVVDPTRRSTVYMATSFGVVVTVDGGISWSSLDTADGGTLDVPHDVYALALAPTAPATLVAGTASSGAFAIESTCRTDAECDDGNPCTHDACATVCVHPVACFEGARCSLGGPLDSTGCKERRRRRVLGSLRRASHHLERAYRRLVRGDRKPGIRALAATTQELERMRSVLLRSVEQAGISRQCYSSLDRALAAQIIRVRSASDEGCFPVGPSS